MSNNSSDARERARQIASKQAKLSRNSNGGWIKATVALVAVAIIAIVAAVIINTNRNKIEAAGPVPASSNQYGGIVLTKDGIEKDTSAEPSRDLNSLYTATASHTVTEGAEESAMPLGVESAESAAKNGQPVRVTIFEDFNCVHCAEFETQYGETIQQLVDEGKITLEVRNLTYLDASSATQYSARAANAAYEVANQVSTDDYFAFQKEMFSHQGEGGLSNDEIIEIASKHGADIKDAMKKNTWRSLVNVVTSESSTNGVPGTPTVFADGQQYTSTDFTTWLNGIIDAKANA